jgi:hypothetical protein
MKAISVWILILLTAALLYNTAQRMSGASAQTFTFTRFLQELLPDSFKRLNATTWLRLRSPNPTFKATLDLAAHSGSSCQRMIR